MLIGERGGVAPHPPAASSSCLGPEGKICVWQSKKALQRGVPFTSLCVAVLKNILKVLEPYERRKEMAVKKDS